MKILVLGNTQSPFINQLYGDIKLKDKSFVFNIDSSIDTSKGKMNINSEIFNKIIDLKNIQVSRQQIYLNLIKQTFSILLWRMIFFELSQGSNLVKIKSKLYEYARVKYITKHYVLTLNNDIYHFHYCVPHFLLIANFLPKKTKIIMSFWGSDLLRSTGKSNKFYVRQALKKATRITLQSPEMAEILAIKYGRDLSSKISDIRFTINTDIYKYIDAFKEKKSELDLFKKKYGINKDDYIVTLGHNANKANNHLIMIEQIRKLPSNLKENTSFLIHLGYGGNEEYINTLKKIVLKEKGAKYIIIDEYFAPKEIAKLRLITTIMLQLPLSDALSGAMTEVMYTGNTVIAGGWLPYGILRRNGIRFYELGKFDDLPSMIISAFNNLKNDKELFSANKQKIESFLFPDTTTKEWISLLNSVHNE